MLSHLYFFSTSPPFLYKQRSTPLFYTVYMQVKGEAYRGCISVADIEAAYRGSI
jgi:hypothetical protein